MSIPFNATTSCDAEVIKTVVYPDGSAELYVKNTSSGAELSTVKITVPVDRSANATHERTGDTGVTALLNLTDALTVVATDAPGLLQSVINANKHAL